MCPIRSMIRPQRNAANVKPATAEDETSNGRAKILDRHPQGDQGIKEPVGELDAACREDERPDLRAHRRSLRHHCSNEKIADRPTPW
jgi:hypothetical protein